MFNVNVPEVTTKLTRIGKVYLDVDVIISSLDALNCTDTPKKLSGMLPGIYNVYLKKANCETKLSTMYLEHEHAKILMKDAPMYSKDLYPTEVVVGASGTLVFSDSFRHRLTCSKQELFKATCKEAAANVNLGGVVEGHAVVGYLAEGTHNFITMSDENGRVFSIKAFITK